MGCDICMFVEKINDDGSWSYCHGGQESFYSLFEGLCRTDYNEELISVLYKGLRGFPENASDTIKYTYNLYSWLNFGISYMTLTEALPIFNKYGKPPKIVFSLFEDYLNPTKEELEMFYIQYGYGFTYGLWFGNVDEANIKDYRLIFWFERA